MIRMRRRHPTVTEAVAVTAEATKEAAKQKDDEDNDEYKSERHGLVSLVDPDYPSNDALIFMLPLREMGSLWTGTARSSL
jgi:hypothetical protein